MSVDDITILVADDDEEDRLLIEDALKEARIVNKIDMVKDGAELLDYLRAEGAYAGRAGKPLPGLILLDLNMPRMDGREALDAIKSDTKLRSIPVVVLTTSKAEEDIFRTYNLGVNSFVTKPVSFDALVEIMRVLTQYWFQIVQLPGAKKD
jgi:CheY-like chemotaxis protein